MTKVASTSLQFGFCFQWWLKNSVMTMLNIPPLSGHYLSRLLSLRDCYYFAATARRYWVCTVGLGYIKIVLLVSVLASIIPLHILTPLLLAFFHGIQGLLCINCPATVIRFSSPAFLIYFPSEMSSWCLLVVFQSGMPERMSPENPHSLVCLCSIRRPPHSTIGIQPDSLTYQTL